MAVLLAVVLCGLTGFVVVCLAWPQPTPLRSNLLLKTSLCAGCGLGIFSVVFFLFPALSLSGLILVDTAVFGVSLAVLICSRTRRSSAAIVADERVAIDGPGGWIRPALGTAFALALAASAYASVVRTVAHPHGDGWDAFAIWDLHARFLFRGGPHWKDGFVPLIPWSHPDYPLLLPASIAHFWRYVGHESWVVPSVIALIFAFGTVGLLLSGLSISRGRNQALLGGTMLLATPFFVEQGTSQYADVPLAFFFLATIMLLCLHDAGMRRPGLLALAGLTAGLAAWTKNEGLLFLGAVVLARIVILARHEGWTSCRRQTVPMLLAALPLLLVIAYFKIRVAPAGDLFSSSANLWRKILDPARYWATVQWYAKEILRFGHWLPIPGTVLLAGYYFMVGREAGSKYEAGIRTSVLALGLTLAGYFAVYVITPYDIHWHLRSSLNRLFLQVWPSAIFLFFLTVRTPEQALAD
jgi:hypothetical protein